MLLNVKFIDTAGPTFNDISYREQEYSRDNEGTKEPSGSNKESSICEADF